MFSDAMSTRTTQQLCKSSSISISISFSPTKPNRKLRYVYNSRQSTSSQRAEFYNTNNNWRNSTTTSTIIRKSCWLAASFHSLPRRAEKNTHPIPVFNYISTKIVIIIIIICCGFVFFFLICVLCIKLFCLNWCDSILSG